MSRQIRGNLVAQNIYAAVEDWLKGVAAAGNQQPLVLVGTPPECLVCVAERWVAWHGPIGLAALHAFSRATSNGC